MSRGAPAENPAPPEVRLRDRNPISMVMFAPQALATKAHDNLIGRGGFLTGITRFVTRLVTHPVTLALGAAVGLGYQHNVFNQLGTKLPADWAANTTDRLHAVGGTISHGAQNFWNWARQGRIPLIRPDGSTPGPIGADGQQYQPWTFSPDHMNLQNH